MPDGRSLYYIGYLATAGIFVAYAVALIARRNRARREEKSK